MTNLNNGQIFEIINLNKGLKSINIDLFDFISSPASIKYKKNTESITHEFDFCKYKSLLDLINNDKTIKLEQIEKLFEGTSRVYTFFNDKHLLAEPKWLREKNISDIIEGIKYLSKELEIKTILELGSGYGSKIISLAKSKAINYKIKLIALDISKNGLSCCKELAKRENIILETKLQNFLINPSVKEIVENNTVIFTSYNLHYWKDFKLDNIRQFIKDGIKGGIHIEPCSNLLQNLEDNLYASLASKYIKINNYTENISLAFFQAQEEKLINLKILNEVKGHGLLPAWTFIWQVR